MSVARRAAGMLAALLATLLAACAGQTPTPVTGAESDGLAADGSVLARNPRFVLYRAQASDEWRGIAARFLGDARKWWRVADYNDGVELRAGEIVVVPLQAPSPGGVDGKRFQTVPILCYHRFGPGNSKMIVSAENFARQMQWLVDNDYRVIPLSDLEGFLAGRNDLPRRAVAITIDDGYRTVFEHAYPILKKFAFPATVFLYTDFVGAGDALTWKQMRDMVDSGLIDIQAHSKSHTNLINRAPGEDGKAYAERIDVEIGAPIKAIESRLPIKVKRFAFPYGDVNQDVLDRLQRHHYDLGLTVNPGGNAFFSERYMLRRTMIYGDHSLAAFKARLETSRPVSRP